MLFFCGPCRGAIPVSPVSVLCRYRQFRGLFFLTSCLTICYLYNCIYGHSDYPGLEVVVCLRKSPVRTPALLAANRSNSLKSIGPRTEAGKARVSLNDLKHGRYARHLPQRLHAAGLRDGLLLWLQTHKAISQTFQPQVWQEEAQAQRLANPTPYSPPQLGRGVGGGGLGGPEFSEQSRNVACFQAD